MEPPSFSVSTKAKGIEISDLSKSEYMDIIIRKYGFHDWDAVLAAVGHGGLKEGQIINKMEELYEKEHKKNITDEEVLAAVADTSVTPKISGKGNAIIVKGVHDVAVRFSKCCNPVPGDDIVGFVTRGRGVSIHRSDCVNVIKMAQEEGFSALKFFPAVQAGGTAMLKAWQGPFGDVAFCPTGGIQPGNAAEFLALKNVACVGGSWLVPADALEQGDWSRITRLAREASALQRV